MCPLNCIAARARPIAISRACSERCEPAWRMGRRGGCAKLPRRKNAESDMYDLLNYPLVLFGLSFVTMWVVTRLGASVRKNRLMGEDIREDFGTILATTLTLSSLIIGFSFSMAINRYEQRKNYEEAEANAIGTEYVRADLLPPEDAAQVRTLLRQYLDERLSYYTVRNVRQLGQIEAAPLSWKMFS